MRKQTGFTLVELILVTALSLTVVTAVLPFSIGFYRTMVLREVSEGLVASLRGAQYDASIDSTGTAHGVRIFTHAYVVFAGASYEERDTGDDHIIPRSESVDIDGLAEIVFVPPHGRTQDSGTLQLTSGEETEEISVSPIGYISK